MGGEKTTSGLLRIAVSLAMLAVLSGCMTSSVQPFDGPADPGTIHFFDKDRLQAHTAPDVHGDAVVFERTYLAEPGSGASNTDIFLADTRTGELVRLTDTPEVERRPHVSENYVVWQQETADGYALHALDRATGERRVLHEQEPQFRNLDATGPYAVWEMDVESRQPAIVRMHLGDGTMQTVWGGAEIHATLQPDQPFRATPSADEGVVVFTEDTAWHDDTVTRERRIWIYDLAEDTLTSVGAELPHNPFFPKYHDGAVYFFAKRDPATHQLDLFAVDVETGELRQVAASEHDETRHAPSIRGAAVLRSTGDHENEIVLVRPEGETVLATVPVAVHAVAAHGDIVAWQTWGGPDHSQVYFQRIP